MDDRWDDLGHLAIIATRMFDETGALVHAMPMRAAAWTDRTALMAAIRRDGIEL